MAGTPRIPNAEITGLYGWMLKRFSRKIRCAHRRPRAAGYHSLTDRR